jgi:hypothetical protein
MWESEAHLADTLLSFEIKPQKEVLTDYEQL